MLRVSEAVGIMTPQPMAIFPSTCRVIPPPRWDSGLLHPSQALLGIVVERAAAADSLDSASSVELPPPSFRRVGEHASWEMLQTDAWQGVSGGPCTFGFWP